MFRPDPPLVVRASPAQLSECPLQLDSNSRLTPQPRTDISVLTQQIGNMVVSTSATLPTEHNVKVPEDLAIPKVRYYKGPGKSVLMIMRHPCQLHFVGYLHVTIYRGHVYIFGNDLSLSSKKRSLTIYGSKTAHSIMIETKECKATDNTVLKNFMTSQMSSQSLEILAKLRPEDAVVLIEELELPKLFLSQRYLPAELHPMSDPHTIFPEIYKWMNCKVDGPDNPVYSSMWPPDCWEQLPITDRMMVVGGGGLGKSTLTKFLVNRLLETHDSVLYFELDIGQGDYVPPGTVGTVLIKEPVVGPGYVRFSPVERMIHLGEINVVNCMTTYLRSVSHLCRDAAKHHPRIPVVFNTMGFTKGLGFGITRKLIRIGQPKTLIQIESEDPQKNFQAHFTPKCVMDKDPIDFDLRVIPSIYTSTTKTKKDFGANKTKRNRKLLLSWSAMLRPPHYSFNSVKPFRVSFSSLKLGIIHSLSQTDILRALNGCLVALCEEPFTDCSVLMNTDPTFFKLVLKPEFQLCLGLGLVRGIDAEKKELFLLSPLTVDQMRLVKMLVMSQVETPAEIFQKQTVDGPVPYLVHNSNAEASAPIIRIHRSGPNK